MIRVLSSRRSGRLWGAAAVAAVMLVAGPLFAWRALGRAADPACNVDTRLVLLCSRSWLLGQNPYDPGDLHARWLLAGQDWFLSPGTRGQQALVYPPSAYLLMSPISLLPIPVWDAAWAAINLALYLGAVAATARLAGLRTSDLGFWLLFALALGLGSTHLNFAYGQTAVLTLALIAFGALLRARARSVGAGALLGAAAVLKPQLAAVYVAQEVYRGRWRTAAVGVVTGAAMILAGGYRMHAAGIDWWADLSRNVGAFTNGGDGDPTGHRQVAHAMLHLQSPLELMVRDRTLSQALALVVLGALALAYVAADRRRGGGRTEAYNELGTMTIAACGTLLVAYHRYYDAVLVLFPMALGIALIRDGRRRAGWGTLLCTLPLLQPGPSVLARLAELGAVSPDLTGTVLWRFVLLPHHTWAILLLGVWTVGLRVAGALDTAPAAVRVRRHAFPAHIPGRGAGLEPARPVFSRARATTGSLGGTATELPSGTT